MCGNGVFDLIEECDDSNINIGDGCSADCLIEKGWICKGFPSNCTSVCGDGIQVGFEECDNP